LREEELFPIGWHPARFWRVGGRIIEINNSHKWSLDRYKDMVGYFLISNLVFI
jgi:hypothetical protein